MKYAFRIRYVINVEYTGVVDSKVINSVIYTVNLSSIFCILGYWLTDLTEFLLFDSV